MKEKPREIYQNYFYVEEKMCRAETTQHTGNSKTRRCDVAKDKCLKKSSRQIRSDTGATVKFFILHFLYREV